MNGAIVSKLRSEASLIQGAAVIPFRHRFRWIPRRCLSLSFGPEKAAEREGKQQKHKKTEIRLDKLIDCEREGETARLRHERKSYGRRHTSIIILLGSHRGGAGDSGEDDGGNGGMEGDRVSKRFTDSKRAIH